VVCICDGFTVVVDVTGADVVVSARMLVTEVTRDKVDVIVECSVDFGFILVVNVAVLVGSIVKVVVVLVSLGVCVVNVTKIGVCVSDSIENRI
jgi:hypothetical protein